MTPNHESKPHNPDKLSPKQIGTADGWRLLDAVEVNVTRTPCLAEIESFEHRQWISGYHGSSPQLTYRTRLTRAQLRAARGLSTRDVDKYEGCYGLDLLSVDAREGLSHKPNVISSLESNPQTALATELREALRIMLALFYSRIQWTEAEVQTAAKAESVLAKCEGRLK